jgi:hypothetical protein
VERLLEHLVPIKIIYSKRVLGRVLKRALSFQLSGIPSLVFKLCGSLDGTFLKCSTCVLGGLKSNGVVSTLPV